MSERTTVQRRSCRHRRLTTSGNILGFLTTVTLLASSTAVHAQQPAAAPLPLAPASPVIATVPSAGASSESGDLVSAEQAVARALANNPTLSASQQTLRGAREAVRAETGRYPYAVLADAGFTRSQSPQLRADDSVAAST